MNKLKIGIPRALLYYRYGTLWKTFFRNLGQEVVISSPSNKEIVKKGTSLAVDENCLPTKIFLGHVDYLSDKTDCVFVPRVASIYKKESVCIKLWGISDMTRNVFRDITILDCNIDVHEGISEKKASYSFVHPIV